MIKLEQVILPDYVDAAYAFLRTRAKRQEVLERAVLIMAAIESGDGNKCDRAVEHYGALDPKMLDEFADGAQKLASAFMREAHMVRISIGEQ